MAGGDSERVCGETSEQIPPPPPLSTEEDVGLVQSGGGPRPTNRSNHTLADHCEVGVTLPRQNPPPPPLPGDNIPTSVPPNKIENYVPTEEGVEWKVRRLQGNW